MPSIKYQINFHETYYTIKQYVAPDIDLYLNHQIITLKYYYQVTCLGDSQDWNTTVLKPQHS